MMIPTVHLGGTSKNELMDQLMTARGALNQAISKLRAACPHARDYVTQDRGAAQKALDEHSARLHKLHEVDKELVLILDGISEQGR